MEGPTNNNPPSLPLLRPLPLPSALDSALRTPNEPLHDGEIVPTEGRQGLSGTQSRINTPPCRMEDSANSNLPSPTLLRPLALPSALDSALRTPVEPLHDGGMVPTEGKQGPPGTHMKWRTTRTWLNPASSKGKARDEAQTMTQASDRVLEDLLRTYTRLVYLGPEVERDLGKLINHTRTRDVLLGPESSRTVQDYKLSFWLPRIQDPTWPDLLQELQEPVTKLHSSMTRALATARSSPGNDGGETTIELRDPKLNVLPPNEKGIDLAQRTKHLDANDGSDVVARILVSNDPGRSISFFHLGYKATLEIPPGCAFMMFPFLGCGADMEIYHGGSFEYVEPGEPGEPGETGEPDGTAERRGEQHACAVSPWRTQFKFSGTSNTRAAGVALAIDVHVKPGQVKTGWDVFQGFPRNTHDFLHVNDPPQRCLGLQAAKLVKRGLLNDYQQMAPHGINFHGRRCYREYQKSGKPSEQGRTEIRVKCARRGWRKRYRQSTKKAVAKKLKKGNTLLPIMFSVPYASGSKIETWIVVRFQGTHTMIRAVHRLSETCERTVGVLVIKMEGEQVLHRTIRVVVTDDVTTLLHAHGDEKGAPLDEPSEDLVREMQRSLQSANSPQALPALIT